MEHINKEELEDKLISLKRPQKHHFVKGAVIGIILLGGICSMQQVQIFAGEAVESIFRDRGIAQAVESGYPSIEDVEGMIGGYKIKLTQIYIDAMRLSFKVEVSGLPEESEMQREKIFYMVEEDSHWCVNGQEVKEVGINTSSFNSGETTSIEIVGEGVSKLLAEEEIPIPLKLFVNQYGGEDETSSTLLGETTLILKVPEALHQLPKLYEINQDIPLEAGNIHLESLKVTPTMMQLEVKSQIKGGYITGLNNLKLIGKQQTYTNGIGTSFDEKGGITEGIVPSIYFTKENKLILQADGYSYKSNSRPKVTINKAEQLPKEIVYDEKSFILTKCNYTNGYLEIELLDSDYKGHGIESIYVNGIRHNGMGIRSLKANNENESKVEKREYATKIKVPEMQSYELSMEFTKEVNEPIWIEIDLKEQ